MKILEFLAQAHVGGPITREDVTFVIAVVGCLIALVSLGLGIFNAWLAWRREKVRLKVIPKLYFHTAPHWNFLLGDRDLAGMAKSAVNNR